MADKLFSCEFKSSLPNDLLFIKLCEDVAKIMSVELDNDADRPAVLPLLLNEDLLLTFDVVEDDDEADDNESSGGVDDETVGDIELLP